MTTTIAPFQDAAGWERTPYAFLAEWLLATGTPTIPLQQQRRAAHARWDATASSVCLWRKASS